jgi:hypothetical protein
MAIERAGHEPMSEDMQIGAARLPACAMPASTDALPPAPLVAASTEAMPPAPLAPPSTDALRPAPLALESGVLLREPAAPDIPPDPPFAAPLWAAAPFGIAGTPELVVHDTTSQASSRL